MRKYTEKKERLITELKCNKCGKNIKVENNIVKEGVFSVDYKWNYFSEIDGEKHSFDLCEKCYMEMIKNFIIDVKVEDENELL